MKRQIKIMSLSLIILLMLQTIFPVVVNLEISSSHAVTTSEVTEFQYKNSVQTFTAPHTGKYFLETWGAQGGGSVAGGGYSYGYINLNAGEKLYICTGGQGSFSTSTTAKTAGGYNGGGKSLNGAGSGGGATHIATTNRGTLSAYENYKNEVVMVAGGSGGKGSAMTNKSTSITYSSDHKYQNIIAEEDAANLLRISGNGGGYAPDGWTATRVIGHSHVFSTENSTYKFGVGEDGINTNYYNGTPGAGGGGWEAGTINRGDGDGYDSTWSTGILGGSGGSGYLNEKMLYSQGTEKGTKDNVGNQGNGKAKITYKGPVQTTLTIDTKGHGTINGKSGRVEITGNAGTSIPFPTLTSENGYTLIRYKQIDGTLATDENGFVGILPNTYYFTFKNTTLEADYTTKMNVTFTKKSDTRYDMNINQPDGRAKYYQVFESRNNGVTWSPVKTQSDSTGTSRRYAQKFNYTGSVQEYTAPMDGYYYIEATGASGTCSNSNCKVVDQVNGGRSYGYKFLQKGQTIYVAVGGKGIAYTGKNGVGGWNGGGNSHDHANRWNGGGGGATSWTTSLEGDGQLKRYKAAQSNVILVAGGSGGLLHTLNHGVTSGAGGGLSGGSPGYGAAGGTQMSAGSRGNFGQGGNAAGGDKDQGRRRRWLVWRWSSDKR